MLIIRGRRPAAYGTTMRSCMGTGRTVGFDAQLRRLAHVQECKRFEQSIAQGVVSGAGWRTLLGSLLKHAGPGGTHAGAAVVWSERILQRAGDQDLN